MLKNTKVALYYEAAVAGGIPILRTLVNSLASDKVTKVLGVVNGTSNFMMTKMVEEGWTYEDALAEAQRLGYAESDPTNDVEGNRCCIQDGDLEPVRFWDEYPI